GAAELAVELRLQPYRPFRGGRPRRLKGDLSRRRHPALPEAALRVSRRRRRLGLPAVRRSDRTLGAARRDGARTHEAGKARPQIADENGREIPVRRYRRGAQGARSQTEPRQTRIDTE